MNDDLYYRKLESTSTTGLVDMIREKDKRIAELEQKLEQTEKDLADYQFNYPTIKELQKENAELKKTYRKQRNKRIDELQKENAELKKKYVRNIIDCDICDTYCNSQLTKAKEIIHKVCYEYGIYDKDLMEEAKQFLNSEGK